MEKTLLNRYFLHTEDVVRGNGLGKYPCFMPIHEDVEPFNPYEHGYCQNECNERVLLSYATNVGQEGDDETCLKMHIHNYKSSDNRDDA